MEQVHLLPSNLLDACITRVNDAHQARALRVLQKRAFSSGYRRKGCLLYRPVLNRYHNFVLPSSKNGYAFTMACTVTEFVYSCVFAPEGMDTSLVDFLLRSSRGVVQAVRNLVDNAELWTTEFETNRNIFAFRDGLYDTRVLTFYTFTETPGFLTVDHMSGNVATDQYFDSDFIVLPGSNT